ncbi:MAG: ABC transporter ATP-binding protein [Chloroflexi bacterium]|nr:ABC transporter ATP-binding protein [Chloroflexota bacterium]
MAAAGTPGIGRINYGVAQRPTLPIQRILPRVLGYFRPYARAWAVILVCIGVTSGLNLIPPLMIREILDTALPRGDAALLVGAVAGSIGAGLLARLVGVGQFSLNVRIGQGVMFDLRNELYRHLQRQSLRFYTESKTGELMSRVTNDVNGIETVVTNTLVSIVTNVAIVVTVSAVLISMHWQLAFLALGILPFFVLPTRRVGRVRQQLRRQTAERQGSLAALMQETLSISGSVLMKAFVREPYEAGRFRERSAELRDLEIRQRMVGRWFFMAIGLFQSIGPALIYLYGGWLVIQGSISVGTVVAFVAYLRQLYGPVSELANVHVDVMSSFALFERLFQYLDLVPEIMEAPNALVPPPAQGDIAFDHVSFGYVPGRLALTDVSFVAKPGQLVALVGPSGAGKTTVTYLVPRFYDPLDGRVLVDGHDVRDVRLDWLRSQIGIVTQESFLFHASVRDNLRYARPDATDAEIERACRAAHIHDFIAGLRDGYDTLVGERGYRLSGGEKQRLAIARVLLKDPRILLLDEATSSLDSRSEALIQAALTPLMEGRTSLVIAHRLSTILAADVILVLERGRLVERGTHPELLARGGLYARLYEEQFKPGRNGATSAELGQPDGSPDESATRYANGWAGDPAAGSADGALNGPANGLARGPVDDSLPYPMPHHPHTTSPAPAPPLPRAGEGAGG